VARKPEEFAPNSLLGKAVNTKLNRIDWRMLADAAVNLEVDLAAQPVMKSPRNPKKPVTPPPILGLVRAGRARRITLTASFNTTHLSGLVSRVERHPMMRTRIPAMVDGIGVMHTTCECLGIRCARQ
jgi:hypothetical protein